MGKIKSKHDDLIQEFINDPKYLIHKNGTIVNSKTSKKLGYKFDSENRLRNKQYLYVKYKNKRLKIHRIIYAKFLGELKSGLVVHHKDNDSTNNHINNLEQVSQALNIHYKYR